MENTNWQRRCDFYFVVNMQNAAQGNDVQLIYINTLYKQQVSALF